MDLLTKDKARYSRADLLALRYEGSARQRPNCSNRTELQTLNFWKVPPVLILPSSFAASSSAGCYASANKSCLSPETDNSSLSSTNNGLISSRRALRNRERANNYYQRFAPSDAQLGGGEEKEPASSSALGPAFKSSHIDQRSISSSHLMPAFAKRRFAAATGGGAEGNDLPNNNNNTESLDGERTATPTQVYHARESKGHALVSPTPKADHDHSLASSPTFSAARHERRIDSGRLLPRNDNWDYKRQESEERGERPQNPPANPNQQRQRTFSGRQEQPQQRSQYDGKRPIDRQGTAGGGGGSNRRPSNKDKYSFGEGGIQGRGKRTNMYHQMHEEPEWFSAGPTSQLETIDLHGFDDLEPDSKDDSTAVPAIADQKATVEPKDIEADSDPPASNAEVEFNFDAFLNMDPLEHSLMGNDMQVPGGEHASLGKSRFSRWFGPNEAGNNNEAQPIREVHTPETHGIPSVKDLEAQMTKVDLRPELTNAMPTQVDKPVARDTEGFKRLLQQLGAQHNQQQQPPPPVNDLYQMMSAANASAVRNIHRSNAQPHPHLIEAQQNLVARAAEELQGYQQRQKAADCMQPPHRIAEQAAQVQAPPPPALSVIVPNAQAQKRMEIQHLLQGIFRGDISLEFLEKELNNPNTPPPTKEVIAIVFRELANPRRNSIPQKPTYQNDLISHHNMVAAHAPFNPALVASNVSEEMFTTANTAPPPSQGLNQHIRHSNSPTPLAFTPTSVLRKMTADKDTPLAQNSSSNQQQQHQKQQQYHQFQLSSQLSKPLAHNIVNESQQMPAMNLQPRMILGGGGGGNYTTMNQNSPQISPKLLPQSRNQQQIKWPPGGNMQAAQGIKSFGRPILKGTLNSVAQPQVAPPLTLQQIHQQRLKESILNSDSLHNVPFADGISHLQQQQQHHYLQQPQAQARQPPRHRMMHGELHRQPQSIQPDASSESGNVLKNINYHRDDRLSPTTNQLAQWFSPELLARASAGKLPLLNVNQALSLEEFERSIQHSSATVHN